MHDIFSLNQLPTLSQSVNFLRSRNAIEDLWDKEYSLRRSLPSTNSYKPSRCFSLVSDLFDVNKKLTVLDIGCGNGRHTSYFARLGATVHALDISNCAIEIAKKRLYDEGLSEQVEFHHQSVFDSIPCESAGFDLILDSYMSCHLLVAEERVEFLRKISKLLTPSGVFISFGVSRNDSFYSSYTRINAELSATVLDPITGIEKILTTEQYLLNEFKNILQIERLGRLALIDTMGLQTYDKEAIYIAARKIQQ